MLLGQKKTQKSEQNWCLILNPLYNEIDKRKVARKITESFGLSAEESNDLVNNTPIILLDNLSENVATQLKSYFRPTGAELLLTNDVFVKRKCYRTVWPEPPSLSFLHGEAPKPEIKKDFQSEKLQPDDALNELRSLGKTALPKKDRPLEPEPSTFVEADIRKLELNIEQLKKEAVVWREKYEGQLEKVDDLNARLVEKERAAVSNQTAYDNDQEIEKHKTLLNGAEERYEGLQEEYRQARNLFEEKMTILNKDLEEQKASSEALNKKLQNYEAAKVTAEQQSDEESRKLIELESSNNLLSSKLKEEQEKHEKHRQDYDHLKALYDEKTATSGQELENWKSYAAELSDKLKEIELQSSELSQNFEIQSKNAAMWQQKAEDLEASFSELKISHASIETIMRENVKLLSDRERELELARRQNRELKSQAEQREALQKREQLASIISDKEARLKELVTGQERMEREIKERESVIREILTDQEKAEKDIIEAKQAQRHYLELIKKENNSRSKITKIFSPTLTTADKNQNSPKDD